jgi:hypothetical protein
VILENQVRRDLGVIDLGQVPLDLADRQTTGIQADPPVVKPDPPGLALLDDLGLKRALTILSYVAPQTNSNVALTWSSPREGPRGLMSAVAG